MSFQYIVTKPFKYGGKTLKVGDVFTPGNGSFDRQIIESERYVMIQEAPEPKAKTTRRRRSKADG